jgi:hypothetical protein
MNTERLESIRYRRDLWRALTEQEPKEFKILPQGVGDAAEIGVAEGNFAEEILNWPIQFKTVYIIDRWIHFPIKGDSGQPQIWHDRNLLKVQERTKKFGRRAEILKMNSAAAAAKVPDGSLSFINIDADHSYEGVRGDIESWWRKLAPMGVIAFHDYRQKAYGVERAVNEFAKRNTFRVFDLLEDKAEDAGAFIVNPTI